MLYARVQAHAVRSPEVAPVDLALEIQFQDVSVGGINHEEGRRASTGRKVDLAEHEDGVAVIDNRPVRKFVGHWLNWRWE